MCARVATICIYDLIILVSSRSAIPSFILFLSFDREGIPRSSTATSSNCDKRRDDDDADEGINDYEKEDVDGDEGINDYEDDDGDGGDDGL